MRELFHRLGATEMTFQPAIFAHYAMFFTASRRPVATYTDVDVAATLRSPGQRVALALLDLGTRYEETLRHLVAAGQDRAARLTPPDAPARGTLAGWLARLAGRRA